MVVIDPVHVEWVAPIVSEHKKDGPLWICMKYPKLNPVIIRVSYPTQRMDKCIDSFSKCHAFLDNGR